MVSSADQRSPQVAVGFGQIGWVGTHLGTMNTPEHPRPDHAGHQPQSGSGQDAALTRLQGLLVEGRWPGEPEWVTWGGERKPAFCSPEVPQPAHGEHDGNRLRVVGQASQMVGGVATYDSFEGTVGAGGST
jgi:hypothetical protein